MTSHEEIRQRVFDRADRHTDLLRRGLEASFEDVDTFQEWVAERLDLLGASTERFTLSRGMLTDQPAFRDRLEHDPESVRLGTNVVGRFPGRTDATTVLFAHADKAPVSYEHVAAGHGVDVEGDRLVGPGIADDISGVTATIGALETLAQGGWEPATSVLVASIFGKQLGVGGTYGLVRQYGPADAAVYAHPAESGRGLNDLKVGSNGLYEFVIELEGEQPPTSEMHHPLYAHQGVNPVDATGTITGRLHDWADTLAEQHPHAGVERAAGASAGLLVSDVQVDDGDRAVYQMPRECTVRAAVAFPPGVSLETVERDVRQTVTEAAAETGVPQVAVHPGDHVADSAEAPTDTLPVETATDAIETVTGDAPEFYYGHTASDIRYPMQYWGAPTVGFGPQAGAMGDPDEWIDSEEYLETIGAIAAFLVDFTPDA
ncbi:M20/M25/M40 family metallo-hydrolase [Halorarius halobius]|uniref:M20/M25/M40 family metallo-hydrolase n=1 Tax=Halorarius halobius TaxID=2962671 RepID=UPI0020CBCB81|nr:M20/M25/M40 family metallo-hydrolase [Halorarius halobius]